MEDDNLASSQTLASSSQDVSAPTGLDLSNWPPIFVSATHFDQEDLHELEEQLENAHAILTFDIRNEAEIILSKVLSKLRIKFDLKSKGLYTDDAQAEPMPKSLFSETPTSKKRKHDESDGTSRQQADAILLDDSSTESEVETDSRKRPEKAAQKAARASHHPEQATADTNSAHKGAGRIVTVVKIDWFIESKRLGQVQPLQKYLTYRGHVVEQQDTATAAEASNKRQKLPARTTAKHTATSQHATTSKPTKSTAGSEILQRAQEDAPAPAPKYDRFGRRNYHYPNTKTPSANPASWEAGHGTNAKYAHLLQQTTTDNDNGYSSDLPEMPEWVKRGIKYACQRLTPKSNPNEPFISLLKEIKTARELTNDEIGVRAYSTSIAAIAAYTHKISNPKEIMKLPGCDSKIANLWVEWKNEGKIQAVEDLRADEEMKGLRLFYNIWGVGAKTAREFYFDKGWRDLDDIVEYGWSTLHRVQQIGVKYYEEFEDLIPRAEVESICEVIRQHAVRVRDSGIQTMIVGGYRRGKEASGDVDIVVSHPEESCTQNLVDELVTSLESEEWITHTLTLSTASSDRSQQTLPFRAGGGGHGFDTLDKALVVWQDPNWPTKERDLAESPKAKNPNIHRRVDIIVSPWRTVGCAVVGWSGGTTFERDLRRYAKNLKGWKFDSSGVRDRGNGEVVDLEGYFNWKRKEGKEARAKTMVEAEKRVFEGFGLEYREPWERCTG